MFSCIWLIFRSSLFVLFIVSPPYVRIGCIQVSRSFHAVSSSILLKYWLPSTVRIVWYAVSVFLFNCITWSSAFPLWFSISPRYLYWSVYSSFFSLRYMSGLVVLFPIFSILLLADPNSMWYLFATSFVILSIFCSSFGSLLIKATSSIHSRHPIGSFEQPILGPISSLIISLFCHPSAGHTGLLIVLLLV